jgi:hypothetical protein
VHCRGWCEPQGNLAEAAGPRGSSPPPLPAKGPKRSAEGVVSVGMGGIDGQNLAIRCLSLEQPSGPIVNETPLKQITLRPSDRAHLLSTLMPIHAGILKLIMTTMRRCYHLRLRCAPPSRARFACRNRHRLGAADRSAATSGARQSRSLGSAEPRIAAMVKARSEERAAARAGRRCAHCNEPITAQRSSNKFCSVGCRVAAHRGGKRYVTAWQPNSGPYRTLSAVASHGPAESRLAARDQA